MLKMFIGPNNRPVDMPAPAHEPDPLDGVIIDEVDPQTEKTEKVKVARYAYHDTCTKCGAAVHVVPDSVKSEPATIIYNKRYQIIGCPSCMNGVRK
jgi:hypothetical protein